MCVRVFVAVCVIPLAEEATHQMPIMYLCGM